MKVAVIGCGAIGSRYLQWLAELGCDVAGCEIDDARRQEVRSTSSGPVFEDLQDLLSWAPERAIVAVPPHHHEGLARSVIAAGIPVLTEKPLAHDLESGRRLVEAAKTASAAAHVACNMRFHVGVRAIGENISRAGKVICFRGLFGHRLSQMRKTGGDFARDLKSGGGVVLDCIHEFDYLRMLFGPIRNVRSFVTQIGVDRIEAEDLAEVVLEFESGVIGQLHLDFLMRQKRRSLEVIGSDANLTWLSVGKNPEVCKVTLATNDEETILVDQASVDPSEEYRLMLERFLGNGDGLQSVDEAFAALEAALVAQKGT